MKTDFPNFDNVDLFNKLLGSLPEFINASWKNDACPKLSYIPTPESDLWVDIYVDYMDVSLREFDIDSTQSIFICTPDGGLIDFKASEVNDAIDTAIQMVKQINKESI